MNDCGIEVRLFISPEPAQIDAAAKSGAQFIELHTGAFADTYAAGIETAWKNELDRLIAGARQAHDLGLKVNAGHGLNYVNLPLLYRVPYLVELNIGHSIVSRAISVGMNAAVSDMLALMKDYPQTPSVK
jgi:pyridoxine 5-phosphate synthase